MNTDADTGTATDAQVQALRPDALTRVERIYRTRLTAEPGDMVARVSLAWCLFLQALHHAGRESAMMDLVQMSTSEGQQPDPRIQSILCEGAAREILRDCLRQTITVIQLSQRPQHRNDAEQIQAMVRLTGGDEALFEAQEEANRILSRVAREILNN